MTFQLNERKKLITFWALLIVMLLLFIEALCFVVYKVNPLSVFSWQYYDSGFQGVKPARGHAGWDSYGPQSRPNPQPPPSQCVAAFGDSFTHGDEVAHDEAWSYLASELLGCEIVNHGVGGYGTDQAYIRYKEINPATPVVLLGVYQEMLRRNLSASWVFYGMQQSATLKPYFTLKPDATLKEVAAPANPSAADIKLHHRYDRYYQSFKIQAPYSVSLVRATYYRISSNTQKRVRILPPENAFVDAQALDLHNAIKAQFRNDAARNNQQFAVIFFPTAEQALEGKFPYQPMLAEYGLRHPEVCLIDPGPALHELSLREGRALAAPQKHFDASANKVIAFVVNERLRDCGLFSAKLVES